VNVVCSLISETISTLHGGVEERLPKPSKYLSQLIRPEWDGGTSARDRTGRKAFSLYGLILQNPANRLDVLSIASLLLVVVVFAEYDSSGLRTPSQALWKQYSVILQRHLNRGYGRPRRDKRRMTQLCTTNEDENGAPKLRSGVTPFLATSLVIFRDIVPYSNISGCS
jgi:hypothetical protein